jgi:ribosomal protein L37AE/L43A
MFQKIEPVIRKSIPCPNCGNLFGVDHLNQGQYTWLCNNCDHYFTLKHDGNEYFTKVDSKKEMTTLILKLRQNLPLYFVYPCFKDKDDDYRYHLYNSCQ